MQRYELTGKHVKEEHKREGKDWKGRDFVVTLLKTKPGASSSFLFYH